MVDKKPAHADLGDRHRAEVLFHDQRYSSDQTLAPHYRAHPTYAIFKRMLARLGDLSDKHILEYGCGVGWATKELARGGARVSAFDISGEAVAQARRRLKAARVFERCSVEVMAGEELKYADETFDLAVGFAILHHLDYARALPELHRVLKPGGRALFAEPSASNPVIRLYRRLTPQYRTPDEVPLDLDALSRQLGAFTHFEHHDQLLLASAAMGLCYVPGLARFAPAAQRALMHVDDVFLRVVPRAGRWAWYSILVFKKA